LNDCTEGVRQLNASAPILLWGPPADVPLAAVCGALARQGVPFFFVDQTRVLETDITLEVADAIGGSVIVAGQSCDLAGVRAAYLRPYASTDADDVTAAGQGSRVWDHALAVDDALITWSDLTSSLVINRPSAMGSNTSKPYQAELIRRAGFAVPDTLVTTDLEALRQFQTQYRALIYKSVSGVRSIVSKLTPDHEARLSDIANCPTQFQEYIPGRDFRVHVVGEDVFAHEIVSDADDYRYAASNGNAVQIQPTAVPPDITDRCRALAQTLGLVVAGIDLRRGTNEQWYCFEVNPSPGFAYYEREEDEPIANCIARRLVEACEREYGPGLSAIPRRIGAA